MSAMHRSERLGRAVLAKLRKRAPQLARIVSRYRNDPARLCGEALTASVERGDHDMVDTVLHLGVRGEYLTQAAHIAAEKGFSTTLARLDANGLDLRACWSELLTLAIRGRRIAALKWLIRNHPKDISPRALAVLKCFELDRKALITHVAKGNLQPLKNVVLILSVMRGESYYNQYELALLYTFDNWVCDLAFKVATARGDEHSQALLAPYVTEAVRSKRRHNQSPVQDALFDQLDFDFAVSTGSLELVKLIATSSNERAFARGCAPWAIIAATRVNAWDVAELIAGHSPYSYAPVESMPHQNGPGFDTDSDSGYEGDD